MRKLQWPHKFKNNFQIHKNKAIKKDSFLIQLIWLTPALVLLAIFMFYAIYIAMRFSLNGAKAQHNNFNLTWDHFNSVWKNNEFRVALFNSLIYSVTVVPISLILALFIAKALISVMSKRLFSFLQGLFFLPYVTSAMAISMSFAFIFSPLGVMNRFLSLIGITPKPWLNDSRYAVWTLVIYGIWKTLPLNIVMLTTAMLKINHQYYQAAAIDGVPKWRQFWTITIPLLIPMLIYLSTISLIESFKVFPLGLYGTYIDAARYHGHTVVFWIFNRRDMGNYNEAAAAAIILMIIILIITIITRIISKFLSRRYG